MALSYVHLVMGPSLSYFVTESGWFGMPSIPINPHQSPSITNNPHQSPTIAINHHQSPTITNNPHQSPSIANNHQQSPSITLNPHQYPSYLHGCSRAALEVKGCHCQIHCPSQTLGRGHSQCPVAGYQTKDNFNGFYDSLHCYNFSGSLEKI